MKKAETVQNEEKSPFEIILNDTGKAIEMLYDCKAKIEVLSQLFSLKRNDDKDFTFYDGLVVLNKDMFEHIGDAVELLLGVEFKAKEGAEIDGNGRSSEAA